MRSARWVAALLLICATTLLVAEEPLRTPPVPLYTPALHTPLEAAGSGEAPEITVRMTVDPRGLPTGVTVELIDPPSQLDALFTKATIETLNRWRYAPATEDGQPVARELSWMIQFQPLKNEEENPDVTPFRWRVLSNEKPGESYAKQILALPNELRIKALAEASQTAGEILDEAKLNQHQSGRFLVYTDAPDPEMAARLASNLEATFNVLDDLVGHAVVPQPEANRIVAVMYSNKNKYGQFTSQVRGLEWSAGFYSPLGMLAFHMEMPSNEALLSIMLHETTHAYVDRFIARPGVHLPRWLGEGFAEYVGNSRIKKGELIPGKMVRSELYQTDVGAFFGTSSRRMNVDAVKKAMRKGNAPTLMELVSADRGTFYSDEMRSLSYPMAWLLVHFLRHGGDDWAETRFSSLMLYVAEGYPANEVLNQVYGDSDALEREFREYVLSF